MGISPNLIQAFVTFCESSSIESAATTIGITQPALSKQLKNFNSLLPYEVFTFHGKKKVLTPFGKTLYLDIKDKFHSLDKSISSVCNSYGDIENSIVKIAARTEIIERLASNLKHKGRIDYFECNHEQIISNILSGEIDIGITHSVPNSYEIQAKKVLKEKFNIVIPKKLIKIRGGVPTQNTPVIAYKENDPILMTACKKLKLSFQDLNIKRICSNYGTIRNMVNQGLGWAVLPSHIEVNKTKSKTLDLRGQNIPDKDFFMIFRKETSEIRWFEEILKEMGESF